MSHSTPSTGRALVDGDLGLGDGARAEVDGGAAQHATMRGAAVEAFLATVMNSS